MSLYGALRSGVSGLFSNSQRMGMISDNIANVNTTGYKRVDAKFSTFITGGGSGAGAYSAGGVINYNNREINQQGNIEGTAFSTDLAISGNGYFVVTRDVQRDSDNNWVPAGDTFFTRSGEFRVDSNGNLRNSEGYYLLSWPPNDENTDFIETNDFGSLVAVNVGNQAFDPASSTEFQLGANLIPTTGLGAANSYSVTQEIIDPQGRARTVKFTFERIPADNHDIYLEDSSATPTTDLDKNVNVRVPNSWRVYASVEDASIQTYNEDGTPSAITNDDIDVPIADVVFDATGRLSTITPPGSINLYQRTQLPMSYQPLGGGVGTNEAGSVNNNRIDINGLSAATRTAIGVILNDSGVTVTGSPPTAADILSGIDSLNTDDFPLAMGQIMEEINGDTPFENAARTGAGLPLLNQSINNLTALSYVADTANGASGDPLGTTALDTLPTTTQYLGGRIINNEGTLVRTTGTPPNQRLQNFATGSNDKLRLTIDYDNSTATESDLTNLDIDLGTFTMNVFEADSALNRSATRVGTVGTGMQGNDGLTQFDDTLSTLRFTEHNGRRFSSLQSVDIKEDGVVEGFYDNGETRELFKVPLVTFANPNGLKASSGNIFEQTNDSGIALTRVAGTSGSGRILNSAREGAAVDLAEEFSNMIVTQRAYSASTKVITTTDSMLDELTRSIR
ncbi:MAG: flagellar hook-basal body complex protein [Alphaproteobacteria bacterium]|nr:flagellar hook-basal body complex protein [Alphaproteobacteria bacterium]